MAWAVKARGMRGRPFRLLLMTVFLISLWYRLNPTQSTFLAKTTILPTSSRPKDIPFIKSSYDWSSHAHTYPIPEAEQAHLPTGPLRKLPPVQHAFPKTAFQASVRLEKRRTAVRDTFVRCWSTYKSHAWLADEVTPLTLQRKNPFGGWAATLVDSLDTLLIMGLWDEFRQSLPAIGALDWANTTESALNVFETTIRHLGGLLGAYDLSGEKVLLQKAVELGEMLLAAFDTPNHMPPFWLDFAAAKAGTLRAGTWDPSASPCSLALEFTRLAQLTGEDKFFDAVDRVKRFLARSQAQSWLPGMWPTMINFADENVAAGRDFTLGALADSLYEYLPKMFALLGGRDPEYETMYRLAMDTIEKHLLFRPMLPDGADVLFSGNAVVRMLNNGENLTEVETIPEGQHLGCFVGGMFGLGGKLFSIDQHVRLGERLARGCSWAYGQFPTGIMPEIFGLIPCDSLDGCAWNETRWETEGDKRFQKGWKHARDSRYILRPEAIESVFLMYRMTGDTKWQDVAWDMFQAIEKATKTEFANSAIADVTVQPESALKLDSMESFWMAETLKYFYLVFSPPNVISLDNFVFNTEAHPLRRPVK